MLEFEIRELEKESRIDSEGRLCHSVRGDLVSDTHRIGIGRAAFEIEAKYPVPKGWERDLIALHFFTCHKDSPSNRKTLVLFRLVDKRIKPPEVKFPVLVAQCPV